MTYADVFAGYEARREKLRDWLLRHYITEFGLRPGTLLDTGCGNGFWTDLFRAEGFDVRGVDLRADLIADARTKYPGIPFRVGDIEKRLVGYGRFDVVFARTLPQFYAPTLDRLPAVVANLLWHRADTGMLLLSIYSDGSGEDRGTLAAGPARHHPTTAYLDAVEAAGGTPGKVVRVGNYLQLAVQ